MIKFIKSLFESAETKRRKAEYEYLSQSTDLVDLERRQRQLMNSNLKGWV